MQSHKEILEKAIRKAVEGGWEYKPMLILNQENISTDNPTITEPPRIYSLFLDMPLLQTFAKALWGEHTETMIVQNNTLNVQQVIDMDGWRYHLQQMVIAKDPIKYLGDNL